MRSGRVAPYVITFLLGMTLAGGVGAVAAGKSGLTAKVCETPRHFVVSAHHNSCPRGSRVLTIDERGARGARGQTGARGPAGANKVYVGTVNQSTLTNLSYGLEGVDEVEVPAGVYAVSYSISFTESKSEDDEGQCLVAANSETSATRSVSLDGNSVAALSDSIVLTRATPGPIDLVCGAPVSDTATASGPDLQAIALTPH